MDFQDQQQMMKSRTILQKYQKGEMSRENPHDKETALAISPINTDGQTTTQDVASGIDRHPDRTEIDFRLQIQGNRKLIPCSRTFWRSV